MADNGTDGTKLLDCKVSQRMEVSDSGQTRCVVLKLNVEGINAPNSIFTSCIHYRFLFSIIEKCLDPRQSHSP